MCMIIVQSLLHIIEHYSNTGEDKARIIQLAQQLSLNKGLKKFGNKGRDAAHKEWMKISTLQFEVAVRVRPTLETLTLILRPQSAIFSGGLRP